MPIFYIASIFSILFSFALLSLMIGASNDDFLTVFNSFYNFDNSFEHIVIQEIRLPRTLAAVLSGAGMAVSGGVLQGITRNDLASPSLLAINAGAAFSVVLVLFIYGGVSLYFVPIFAAIGASVSAISVYIISNIGMGGATPLKLTLSGAIVSTLLTSLTTALLIFDHEALQKIRFWSAGSLGETDSIMVAAAMPYIMLGVFIAFLLSRNINLMALGDDVASSLGQNTNRIKILALLASVLCAGGAVALSGPVAFVGLVAPHIVRLTIRRLDYVWLLPFCALVGACIMLLADIVARTVIAPQEIPVGVCTALIGAPLFIYLVRSQVNKR